MRMADFSNLFFTAAEDLTHRPLPPATLPEPTFEMLVVRPREREGFLFTKDVVLAEDWRAESPDGLCAVRLGLERAESLGGTDAEGLKPPGSPYLDFPALFPDFPADPDLDFPAPVFMLGPQPLPQRQPKALMQGLLESPLA